MSVAIVVDWYGPVSTLQAARNLANKHDLADILYLAVGRQKYERQTYLQYVGVASDPKWRLHNGRFPEISSDLGLWIGLVRSQGVAGRRNYVRNPGLRLAEWATAFFLQLKLNIRLRRNPPPRALVLLSRWFRSDNLAPRTHRGHADWPDLIEYFGRGDRARIAWIGTAGRLRRLSASQVEKLRTP